MRTRPCRGCGKKIGFAVNRETGNEVPLDLEAPVYALEGDLLGEEPRATRIQGYVSHFATCPKANQFSGSRPQTPAMKTRRWG